MSKRPRPNRRPAVCNSRNWPRPTDPEKRAALIAAIETRWTARQSELPQLKAAAKAGEEAATVVKPVNSRADFDACIGRRHHSVIASRRPAQIRLSAQANFVKQPGRA